MNKVESIFILFFVYLLSCPKIQAQAPKQNSCPIEASVSSGIYYRPYSLILSSPCEDCNLYYTLDGKEPTKLSKLFKNPIVIEKTTILLVACFNKEGKKTSPTKSYSYIFEESTKLPIVSVIIDPHHLFNPATGLFIGSKPPGSGPPPQKANYKSNRRVLAYIDFFEIDKSLAFSIPSEFKLFGGFSRMFVQKSISLRPNEKLGHKRYHHAIFPAKKYIDYKDIVLRNGGSDFGSSHFRDGLITSLGADMGLITQAYRPCIVYINGEFWGIYNLRERISKTFIARYGNVNKDSIDFMEHRAYVNEGSSKHYDNMKAYIRANDLSKDIHFEHIEKQMNVLNFLDYQSMQIFCDNKDAGGNIKFFRGQKPSDKWQWILYDTDYGFAHAGSPSSINSVAFHLESDGPRWPNPPWSTFLFRNLMKNEKAKVLFLSRFLDNMNTVLSPEYIERRVDSIVQILQEDMPRHTTRWNLAEDRWEREISKIKNFVKDRPLYIRKYLLEQFPTYGNTIDFSIKNMQAAPYSMNEHLLCSDTIFSGVYFSKLDLKLKALGRKNQQFSHWKIGDKIFKEAEITLKLEDFEKGSSVEIFVFFEPFPEVFKQDLIIKNIQSHSPFPKNIIELYNNSNDSIFAGAWRIKNTFGESFTLPNITIPPKTSWYLCNDLAWYKLENPTGENITFCPIPIQDNIYLQMPNGENAQIYNPPSAKKIQNDSPQIKIKEIRKTEGDLLQEKAQLQENEIGERENYKLDNGLKIILAFFTILAVLFFIINFYFKKNL